MLAAAGFAIAGYSIVAGAAPRVQTGPNAEVTHDGLTRVDKSVMDVAYVKADLDLRPYKKLWLVGADIQYRAVDDKGKYYRPGRDDQTEFRDFRRRQGDVERSRRRSLPRRASEVEALSAHGPRGSGHAAT